MFHPSVTSSNKPFIQQSNKKKKDWRLKCPDGHGVQEGHVLGSFDRQLAAGVEVDDLRHAVEQTAVLAQDVLVVFGSWQLHVHETLAAPIGTKNV